jgi:CheY-like chemotaxis protein
MLRHGMRPAFHDWMATRYLVVDDNLASVRGLEQLLRGEGRVVAPFTSGAEAVEALSREPFDAVLTDLEMRHTDGFAIVRATHEHQPNAHLVVATASAQEKQQDLVEAGACRIIIPVMPCMPGPMSWSIIP